MNNLRTILLYLLAIQPGITYCQIYQPEKVTIYNRTDTDKISFEIIPAFNGKPLILADQYYVNQHGDTVYIDGLRFYMTDINFIGAKNADEKNSFLFDAADSGTYGFMMKNIRPGTYSKLQFVVGVDSISNTNGANSGDLDPAKGMYWAWNTGYIMAKLDGHSKVCKTLHHAFEFHIGGYKPPYNTARVVTLDLPQPFEVGKLRMPYVTIKVDVAAWFGGNLELSKVNTINTPGKEASLMADRYAKMFSIDTVSYFRLTPR